MQFSTLLATMNQPQYSCDVSIVVPVFNERDNVRLLCDEVTNAMIDCGRTWELLLVDDGSFDGTVDEICQLAEFDDRIKIILLSRNFGQTAALHAGIQNATGRYIVTMDGDLQNDPNDIPMMLRWLDEGSDLVHGWRKDRADAWHRKLPSRIANRLISKVCKFKIHDLGCTLKAMRSELGKKLELYGDMHRFIPILANNLGARCLEVETNHRPRRFGTAKYGIGRTFRVLLDLVTVKYLQSYFVSPMRFFGSVGIWVGLVSMLCFMGSFAMKIWGGVDLTGNPILLLGILTTILSGQFFSLGLLGEVNARIYFAREEKSTYQVRQRINFDSEMPFQAAEKTFQNAA